MKTTSRRILEERGARRYRLIVEHLHDPYRERSKPLEPSVCPECHAVYHAGRWQWQMDSGNNSHQHLCQACRRIRYRYPAGSLNLQGAFIRNHHSEILQLVRKQEQMEKSQHPMHRIMGVENLLDGVMITTTDIHLPARIGKAIHHAYGESLNIKYEPEDYFVRVSWSR